MNRLLSEQIKNTGIMSVELDPDVYEKMKLNLFAALRKFSSSRKTKATYRVIENNVVNPGVFSGEASDYLVSNIIKNNVLVNMLFNLKMFDDSLTNTGAVGYAVELEKIDRQIRKEKTYLGEKQLYNLEQLNEDKAEVNSKFLKSIDYLKLIDGIYFGWLLTLAHGVVQKEGGNKPKIVTLSAEILAQIVKKMYLSVNSSLEPEMHQLIEAITIYFIKVYFYGESGQYALNDLKKAFNDETIEIIKKARVTKFPEFNDLSLLLKEAGVLPLTASTFDLQMQKMFGKYAYETYIQTALPNYIAFMANLAHPTQIFKDANVVDDDINERLEILLLNEQKSTRIEKRDLS